MSDLEGLAEELQQALSTRRVGRSARLLDSTTSTQDEARAWATAGAPEGALVWAMAQTAGRGRLERSWHSQAGDGLWFSLLVRPRVAPTEAGLVALAAGVGVQAGLSAAGAAGVVLKWPNDLRAGGRKLGGILAEAVVASGELRHVVLGIGINLRMPADASLEKIAAALDQLLPGAQPAAVMAAILRGVEDALDALDARGPAATRTAWLAVSETIGREVRALTGAGVVEGTAVDLDESGSLLIRTADREVVRISTGEIQNLR